MTAADLMRPVTTRDVLALWFELVNEWTRGKITNWAGMAKDWNTSVFLSADGLAHGQKLCIFLKSPLHLSDFGHTVVALPNAHATNGANGVLNSLTPPLRKDALALLMSNVRDPRAAALQE